MSDHTPERVLPSTAAPQQRDGALPSATPELARAADSSTTTRELRIRVATDTGGLTQVPPEYGDGDWQTIQSASLFERLYLDGERWETIDPSLVQRNYEVLRRFWDEKIALMQQGSAETQILQRYGGPDRNRNLILKYPDKLRESFDRLRTPEAVAKYVGEIQAERLEQARPTLETVLDMMFADGIVEPAETWRFMDAAASHGVNPDQASRILEEAFANRGFRPTAPAIGRTRAEQLASVSWNNRPATVAPSLHPVVAQNTDDSVAETLVAEAPSRANAAVVPQPPRSSKGRSVVTIATIAAALLVALFAIASLFIRSTTEDRESEAAALDIPSQTGRPPELSAMPPVSTSMAAIAPTPIVSRPIPQTLATANAVAERNTPPPVVSKADRERAVDQLRAIEQRSAADPAAALDEIAALDAELSRHAQEYAAERLVLVTLREQLKASIALADQRRQSEFEASARAEEVRQGEWEKRLSVIEGLMQSGNYSGAEKLASQLVKEPDIPSSIAQRAQALGDEAFTKLQDSWSRAKVNSKTTRSKRN